ncbi:MAG: hypothetical protein L0Z46_12910 [Nitrospiraceae bacterium]|nr:hypothetical protein [Nitrospiraceae bacterium]
MMVGTRVRIGDPTPQIVGALTALLGAPAYDHVVEILGQRMSEWRAGLVVWSAENRLAGLAVFQTPR